MIRWLRNAWYRARYRLNHPDLSWTMRPLPVEWTFGRRLRHLLAEILIHGPHLSLLMNWRERRLAHEEYARGASFGRNRGDFDVHVPDPQSEGAGGRTVRLALNHWKPQVISGGKSRPIGFKRPGDGGDAA